MEQCLVRLAGRSALAGGGAGGPKRIEILAYTGGELLVDGFSLPVVVDLAGLEVPSQVRPILIDHMEDVDSTLGQTTSIVVDQSAGTITATGMALGVSDKATRVVAMAGAGYQWQASVGLLVNRQERIEPGASVIVNGRAFAGPVIVARASEMREISFVATGADDQTAARIAAKQGSFLGAGMKVDPNLGIAKSEEEQAFEKWLAEKMGFDPVTLTPDQLKNLLEVFEKSGAGKKPNMAAHMQNPVFTVTSQSHASPQVLAAAMCRKAGLPGIGQHFDANTVRQANAQFPAGMTIRRLMLNAAASAGYNCEYDAYTANFPQILRAAFSTADIGGILANVANKHLLDGWRAVEQSWRKIATIRPVNDFRESTGLRLTSSGTWDQLADDGLIPHGTLGNDPFTNRAYTYGEMIGVTRAMLLNDDMSALSKVPRMLGRKGALTFNEIFWRAFLALNFWNAGNGNYIDGAGTDGATGSVLASATLSRAVTLFREQTDTGGHPLSLEPKYLLVPPALETTARGLYTSMNINTGGASTADMVPNANVHSGRYEPVVSSYLSNSRFDGASDTAWYLLADPQDAACIEAVFLNGNEEPAVQTAEADFNMLGVRMRAYHDFGVAAQEKRAGVKSLGAAAA